MTKSTSDQRYYDVQQSGVFTLISKTDDQPASYGIGIVQRGLRRVFAGYFVEAEILGGERLVGVDDNSMVLALGRLQRETLSRGPRLDCVALSGQWFESGFSANSGLGVFRSPQPAHAHDGPDA